VSNFRVDVDVPTTLRLRINGRLIVEKAGRRIARLMQQQIRAGIDGNGAQVPKPKRGNRPLVATGQLARSIASDRARKGRDGGPISAVRATGFHSIRAAERTKSRTKLGRYGHGRGGKKRERPANAKILASQAKRMARPLLALTEANAATVAAAMKAELIAQVNAGGLVTERRTARRLYGGGLF
jgi:hypothetical protein